MNELEHFDAQCEAALADEEAAYFQATYGQEDLAALIALTSDDVDDLPF